MGHAPGYHSALPIYCPDGEIRYGEQWLPKVVLLIIRVTRLVSWLSASTCFLSVLHSVNLVSVGPDHLVVGFRRLSTWVVSYLSLGLQPDMRMGRGGWLRLRNTLRLRGQGIVWKEGVGSGHFPIALNFVRVAGVAGGKKHNLTLRGSC